MEFRHMRALLVYLSNQLVAAAMVVTGDNLSPIINTVRWLLLQINHHGLVVSYSVCHPFAHTDCVYACDVFVFRHFEV